MTQWRSMLLGVVVGLGIATIPTSGDSTAPCRISGTGRFLVPQRTPDCTPGQWIDTGPSRETVCATSYNPRPSRTEAARLKRQGLRLYGLPSTAGASTESDHLYPVWLGGASTRANTWPERNYAPKDQTTYVHNPKDKLELAIYAKTCHGHSLTIAQARAVFEGDWRRGYRKYVLHH